MVRRAPRILRSALAVVLLGAPRPLAAGEPPLAPSAPAAPARGSGDTASLDVLVSDAGGKPLAGAFVMAVPVAVGSRPIGLVADQLRSALTGADGRARLETLPLGPWTVSVHARGHVVKRLPRLATGPLAVRLERGGAVNGTVRAADSGRPIVGARVRLGEGSPLPQAWQVEATRVEAVSDGQGRFRIEGVGRAARITARAAGFGVAVRDDVRPGDAVDLFLFPGATLTGTVRDEARRPVAGALVRADGDGRTPSQTETTDARGVFVMAGIRPGEYVVVAREGARAPGIASVVVAPEAEADVALVLFDGGFATGRVVDTEGRPLAGRVRLEVFEQSGLSPAVSDAISAVTRSDGRFALGPLPPGALGLGVSAARHAARRVELTLPARGRSVDLGAVTLETGPSLRGHVRDAEGLAIPGARVAARTQVRGVLSQGEAVAEADGGFLIAGLRAAPHQVTASASGHAAARTRATPGAAPVELVLERGGEITGRVVDAQGAPVEDAEVDGQPADEPLTPTSVSGGSDEGDGRFTLRDVGAGRYVLQARASGRGEASLADVRVAAGRTTDVGVITLSRGGVVLGTVLDTQGAGVPGADVQLEKDLSMQTGRLASQSGANGAFELRGVPPGRIHVLVRHPAFAAAKPVVADVDPGQEPRPVRVVLSRGARLEGRAHRRDGTPFTGGRVTISSFELGPAMGWEPAALGADGSFSVEHVAVGPATVNLMAFTTSGAPGGGAGGNALASVAAQDVELREGETTTVSFALHDVVVAGRVTRGEQPAPGVYVSLLPLQGAGAMLWSGSAAARALPPASGPPPLAGASRDDGSFELLVFQPGPYRVAITTLASGQRHADRTLDLPDVERYELDLQLADTTASGSVVDRETGLPLADASVSLTPVAGEGRASGSTVTGPDGTFSLAVEPGDYTLRAHAPRHKPASLRVVVSAGGAGDLRVEMERGLAIAGRVVDEAGRPQGDVDVTAMRVDRGAAEARTLPDGTFNVDGLAEGSYTLVAGTGTGGFALRTGVSPGGEPVALVLRPGGKVAIRVLDAAGRPVKDSWPAVVTWSGAPVALPHTGGPPTDANGACELSVPAGRLELRVFSEQGHGSAQVTVRPEEVVPVELRLQEATRP